MNNISREELMKKVNSIVADAHRRCCVTGCQRWWVGMDEKGLCMCIDHLRVSRPYRYAQEEKDG